MNEDERFYWKERRGWSLPAQIARLIEAFECHQFRAIEVLRFKYLLGNSPRSQNEVNESVAQARVRSDALSSLQIYEKTLHRRNKYLSSYSEILDNWYEHNRPNVEELNGDLVFAEEWYTRSKQENEDYERKDPLSNPLVISFLEDLSRLFDENPDSKHTFATERGLDPGASSFDLALQSYAKQRNQNEAGYFANIGSASATIFWAKEMVGRLGEVVEREDALSAHSIADLGESIPRSIRALFEQAHMCYLFDFDIPCTITCGSLLEEAIETRFPQLKEDWERRQRTDRKSVSWMRKLEESAALLPALARVKAMASDVVQKRNDAVHDPAKYLAARRGVSNDVLLETRDVLRALFEPEIALEGRT
jgi:hypothetical protein